MFPIIYGLVIYQVSSGPWHVWFTMMIILIIIAMLSFFYVNFVRPLNHFGDRLLIPDASEVLAKDRRPPILYLRPFSVEGKTSKVERILVRILEDAGPVIAIGKPGDAFPRLGAARIYVDDSDWQAAVADLMDRSSLVMLVGGGGQGLEWEINECVQRVGTERLLLALPKSRRRFNTFAAIFKSASGVDISDAYQKPTADADISPASFNSMAFRDFIFNSPVNVLMSFTPDWSPVCWPISTTGDGKSVIETRLFTCLHDVLTNGTGRMPDLASTIREPPVDAIEKAAWHFMRLFRMLEFWGFGLFLLWLLFLQG